MDSTEGKVLFLGFRVSGAEAGIEEIMKTNRNMRSMFSAMVSSKPTLGKIFLRLHATPPFKGSHHVCAVLLSLSYNPIALDGSKEAKFLPIDPGATDAVDVPLPPGLTPRFVSVLELMVPPGQERLLQVEMLLHRSSGENEHLVSTEPSFQNLNHLLSLHLGFCPL